MVMDITRAFRAKNGFSLNDNAYVFTGDVAPTDASVPSVPYGSLYIRTGAISGVFEFTPNGWINILTGSSNDLPSYVVYGMSGATTSTPLVFTITSMTKNLYYFMSLRRSVTLEVRGVAGRLRMFDAGGSYYVIAGSARANNTPNTAWPILYNLTPGVYAFGPTATGTQTLSIYGMTGSEPVGMDFSFSANSVVDNGIFLWHGTSFIPAEAN